MIFIIICIIGSEIDYFKNDFVQMCALNYYFPIELLL